MIPETQNEDPIKELKEFVFSDAIKKDKQSDVSNRQKSLEWYLKFLYEGSDVTNKYHTDIIKQAQFGLIVFMAIFSLTTAFICFMSGYVIIKNNTEYNYIIPLIVSSLVDLISAIMINVMNNLMQSRDKFFMESINSDKLSKMIGLVQNMDVSDSESKNKMIEKLIDNYCDNVNKIDK